jgi:HSP20 family protein
MDLKSLMPFSSREAARRGDPFASMRQEMDRVFDELGKGFGLARMWSEGEAAPRIDLDEDDTSLTLRAEVPGVEEKDIDIQLYEGTLTIKGEKHTDHEEEKEGRHITERAYGSFMRRLSLPCAVDEGKIEAKLDNGVLVVKMPKSPEVQARTRKIPISKS